MPVLILLLVILLATLIGLAFSLNALYILIRYGLPFVTTPRWAIDWQRDNLVLTARDTVYELGCGDARVISALAKRHLQTQFVGLEIQWWPYLLARWRVRRQTNVQILRLDFLGADLRAATVVYGFYINTIVDRVAATLRRQLRPGTRVISFGFQLPGWKVERAIANPDRAGGSQILFLRPSAMSNRPRSS